MLYLLSLIAIFLPIYMVRFEVLNIPTTLLEVLIWLAFLIQIVLDKKLNLPKKDFIPVSLEEEILTFADKFHTKTPAFVDFNEAKSKLEKIDIAKGVKMDLYRKKFGLPDLDNLKKEYSDWHKEFKKFWEEVGG